MAGRIDLERHSIAFAAPGGARLEFGAIGHLDVDDVVIGMRIGLHGVNPSVRQPVPTGSAIIGKAARLIASPPKSKRQASSPGGSATIAVNSHSHVVLSSTLARPLNL